MKKLLAVVLGLFICFSLTACGAISKIIDQITTADNGDSDGDQTQPAGVTTTKSDGGSQKDSMKSEEEVKALIGDTFVIDLKITESSGEEENETHYYAASDGTYYYASVNSENGHLYKELGDGFISYEYDTDLNKYRSLQNYRSVPNPFTSIAIVFLVQEEIEYTSKTSVTFLNRPCTKYIEVINNGSFVASASSEEEWIIDNQTGLCLKHALKISASTTDEGYVEASGAFEVAEFVTDAASVSAFMKEHIDKIVVSEWDIEMFSYAGLEESGTYKFALTDILDSSVVEKLVIDEAVKDMDADGVYCYDVNYYLYVSQGEGEAISNKLVQNFYGLGAKYNSDYELKPIDSSEDTIYFVEREESGTMSYSYFTGYISDSNFHVSIDLEWNPYINNGVWKFHLIVNSD